MAGLKWPGRWPFRQTTTPVPSATQRLVSRYEERGVIYSATPELPDWPAHWDRFGDDAATVALLAQGEELGYVEPVGDTLVLDWAALYRFLQTEETDPAALLALLKLPAPTALRPALNSQGSLEDPDFRITLADWSSPADTAPVRTPHITGAILTLAGSDALLAEPVWRLVSAVRAFHTRAPGDRSPRGNRQAWAAIRRHAQAAGVLSNPEMSLKQGGDEPVQAACVWEVLIS